MELFEGAELGAEGVEDGGAAVGLDDEELLVEGAAGLSDAFLDSDFESEDESPELEPESLEPEAESDDLESDEESLELELLGA